MRGAERSDSDFAGGGRAAHEPESSRVGFFRGFGGERRTELRGSLLVGA